MNKILDLIRRALGVPSPSDRFFRNCEAITEGFIAGWESESDIYPEGDCE